MSIATYKLDLSLNTGLARNTAPLLVCPLYRFAANRPASMDAHDVEKTGQSDSDISTVSLKLDKHGLPLVPQPTGDPLDPLSWRPWLKFLILIEVSLFTLLSLLSASMITPNFQVLSVYLHRDVKETAYVASIFILTAGCSAWIWNPIANVYGRRPMYLLSVAASVAFLAASGASRSYGELIAFRALNGFFGGIPLGLGSATVCDIYFGHERGRYLGIYTLSLITGPHLAPVFGGFIEKNLTWRCKWRRSDRAVSEAEAHAVLQGAST